MNLKNDKSLFNSIAPVYGLYFESQKKTYAGVIEAVKNELDVSAYKTIIDVGCGTGALCSVLYYKGLSVTGVDPAPRMVRIANQKNHHRNITFIQGNVLKGLPFDDRQFDISIASYVAHGLQPSERIRMYAEMARVSRHKVVIFDYNANRALLTTVAEWLEKGDYFNFIRNAESEMENCTFEKRTCFSEVKVVNVGVRAAWYICTPSLPGAAL